DARESAAGNHSLLRLPHHGRHRHADAGACGRKLVATLEGSSLRQPVVPAGLHWHGAAGVHRRSRGLDDDGSRPPALDGLWADTNYRVGVAIADRHSCSHHASGLCGGLSDYLSGRRHCYGKDSSRGPGRRSRSRLSDRERPPQRPDPCSAPIGERPVMTAIFDFVPVWTMILGAGLFFYVALDGFDLGVGMLYGFAPDAQSRNIVMNAIAPIWDGNETWLVLGGVGLLAAFPLAFAIIIPALYFPIVVMLLALVFRGVAFEFRYRDAIHRTFWDHGFCYGSAAATIAQGVMLGAFVQGFKVDGRDFAGTAFDFLTPFSLLTGLALIFGYGLLGAGWLVLKTRAISRCVRAATLAFAWSSSWLRSRR